MMLTMRHGNLLLLQLQTSQTGSLTQRQLLLIIAPSWQALCCLAVALCNTNWSLLQVAVQSGCDAHS